MTETSSERRWYQFHVRHLLFVTTAVAVFCGVGGWLGWRCVLDATLLLIAPAGTLVYLTRTDGKRPLASLFVGPLLLGAVSSLLSVVEKTWALAIGSPLAEPGLRGFLSIPLIFGMGAFFGAMLSAPFFGFWYFAREISPLFKVPRRN